MKYRRERHSVTDLKVHLVCVTKYRDEIFSEPELALIEKVFHDVAKKMDIQILEINGEIEVLIKYIKDQSRPRRTGLYPLNFGHGSTANLRHVLRTIP